MIKMQMFRYILYLTLIFLCINIILFNKCIIQVEEEEDIVSCPVDKEFFKSTKRLDFTGNGINFAVANNVCIDRGDDNLHTRVFIHREKGSKPIMPNKWRDMRNTANNWKYYGFGWSYEFIEVVGNPPSKYEYIGDSAWVTAAAFPRHINHFAENLQILSHLAMNFKCYGHIEHIIFPGYDRNNELDHSNKMMDVYMSMLPKTKLWDNFKKVRCFKKVILLGRIVVSHGGGLFYNLKEAEQYRKYALEYLHIKPENYFGVSHNKIPDKVRIFFSERSTREIKNRNEIYEHVNKYLGHVAVIKGLEMGTITVEKQLQIAMESDIMIGAHGTNLHNSMFMEPGGVVIEITQYHMWTEHFSNLAVATGKQHYLLQANKPVNWEKHSCKNMTVYEGTVKCRDTMFMPLTVDVGWLEIILRKSIQNIIQLKYPQFGGHLRP